MQSWKYLLPLLASTLCFAAQPDRISGVINPSQMVVLGKSLHPKAQPQFDLGVAEPSLPLSYMTLLLAPSPSQQKALDQLLVELQDRKSPNYHKWLTPQQFADRFGLSQNDLNKVTAWLRSEGFQVLSTGGGRNSVIFSGNAAQAQHAFGVEIHHYKVNGEEHFANSSPIRIPATLSGIVRTVMGLHDFRPLPTYRSRVGASRAHPQYYDANYLWPNYVAPGDMATFYNITPLYNQSPAIDGTGQTLAIAGQTDILLADINDFRAGFGLNSIPTGSGGCTTNANGIVVSPCATANFSYVLVGSDSGVVSAFDIGEADLDIEWSGAVARNAQIIFVNAPATNDGVFDALTAVINPPSGPPIAPVVSISYGEGCEAQATLDLETILQQGNAEGVTIMNSSGDVGAATCDFFPPNNTPPYSAAVGGFGVSYPASSPEVTGVGGTEISMADDTNPPNPSLWSTTIGPNGGTVLGYIPEIAWNDNEQFGSFCGANVGNARYATLCDPSPGVQVTNAQTFQEDWWISSSGGGASNCWYENGSTCLGPGAGPPGGGFAQPTYQQGLSVPGAPAGVRYVPDVSLMSSPSFPGYVFCTPINPPTDNTSTCASGIFTAVDTYFSLVGGTSVASPSFAGMVALLNQFLDEPSGQGNINSTLYTLAATPSNNAFHQVTSGDNNVYCQPNTPAGQPSNVVCPATGILGYSASNADPTTGYNLETGLGSVNANELFAAWPPRNPSPTTTSISPSATNAYQGTSVTFTATVTPSTVTRTVSFYNNGSTVALATANLSGGTATFSTSTLPAGTNSVTATYNGDNGNAVSTSSPPAVVTVTAPFTMSASPSTFSSVPAGQTATSTVTITPASGFTGSVSFTNSTTSNPGSCTSGLPAGALCSFSQGSVPLDGVNPATVTLTIATAANMALPPGPQAITVTGTSGSATEIAAVNLTVIPTKQSFTIAPTGGTGTFQVKPGGTATVNIGVTGAGGFIIASSSTTALPITYTCTGSPSLPAAEIACSFTPSNGQNVSATSLTMNLKTTAPTSELRLPLGRGRSIFFALLLPGMFGIVFVGGARSRAARLLSLIVVLGFSTLWLGSCGGGSSSNSSQNSPGTPPGTYVVTVNATTGGANPLTSTFNVTLTVTQ